MQDKPDRRKVLKIAGAAAVAAAAWPVTARSTDMMEGTVTFEGGGVIPEGRLEIYLENPAIDDKGLQRVAETRIESDGRSKAITFSLPPPAGLMVSPDLQIVVRLERADGWLIARGSSQFEAGSPAQITLSTVMY
jgi:hypothetical protein